MRHVLGWRWGMVALASMALSCAPASQEAAHVALPPGPDDPPLPNAPPSEPTDRDNPLAVPTVQSVTPDDPLQLTGSTLTFSATATGEVSGWRWEFGEGASPATSTEPAPIVTLGRRGAYTGHVWASNAAGESAPLAFSYSVEEQWISYPFPAELHALNTPTISMLDGRPYIVATHGYIDSYTRYIAQRPMALHATTPAPQSEADWELHALAPVLHQEFGAIVSSAIAHDRVVFISLQGQQGYQFCGGRGQELRVNVATETGIANPASFNSSIVQEWMCQPPIGSLDVVETPTGLLLLYSVGGDYDELRFAASTVADPTSISQWRRDILFEDPDPSVSAQLAASGQGYAIAAATRTHSGVMQLVADRQLWIVQTSRANPTSAADWSAHAIERWTGPVPGLTSGPGARIALAASADHYLLAWTPNSELKVARSIGNAPRTLSDWRVQSFGAQYHAASPQLFVLDDARPVLAFANTLTPLEEWPGVGELVILRGLSSAPTTTADWKVDRLPGVGSRGLEYLTALAPMGEDLMMVYGRPAAQSCFGGNFGYACSEEAHRLRIAMSGGM